MFLKCVVKHIFDAKLSINHANTKYFSKKITSLLPHLPFSALVRSDEYVLVLKELSLMLIPKIIF